MDWSAQQLNALDCAANWLHDSYEQVFYIAGYAGTGKTTLAQHIGNLEIKHGGYPQYASFTGKSCVVLRRKGCENARTLHSILYTTHEKSGKELELLEHDLAHAKDPADIDKIRRAIEDAQNNLKQPGFRMKSDPLTVWEYSEEWDIRRPVDKITLFIVDECSMIDARLGEDLLSAGARLLVLGDPAQLPPVAGTGFFTHLQNGSPKKPDVMLTEIHRQALDSPIIRMAHTVRNGKGLNLGEYGPACRVVMSDTLKPDDWLAADQILVGKNITRQAINNRVRQLRGFSGFLPQPGEKLVCLRNNHALGVLNGSLWECIEATDHAPASITFTLTVKSLDMEELTVTCQAHKSIFLGTELPYYARRDAEEFDFGSALTVHKSQGSEWNSVILYDEWNREDRARWLYTGISRASNSLTIVRP